MSLNLRLVVLCAIAVLPAAGIQLWGELGLRRERIADIHAQAERAASLAASEMDRVLDATRQLLTAVNASRSVAERDTARCSAYVVELERRLPQYSRIAVVDRDGTVFCTGVSLPEGFGLADFHYFQEAVRTRAFVVGEFRTASVSRRPVLPIALPALDEDGRVDRVAVAAIDLPWLSGLIAARGTPPGGSVTVADRNGTVVARDPEAERFVGTRIPDAFLSLLRAEAAGTLELTSQDGTRRVLGYVPVSYRPPGLYVSAGLSTNNAFALIDHSTRLAFLLIGAGVISAALAALVAGRVFLGPPVRRLLHAMGRWQEGDTAARVGPLTGGSELARLGAGFDAMADALEARTRQLLLLAREVDHRAKNALAVVQAAVRLAPRDDAAAFARAVEGRVTALSRAQILLADTKWQGAALRHIAEGALAPFLPAGQSNAAPRVDLAGPDLMLAPAAIQPLTLALHELATNAAKYGPLGVPGGRVALTWAVESPTLRLRWEETGGPPVAETPLHRGFGSRVLNGTIRDQLGGTVTQAWPPTGLVCDIALPMVRVASAGIGE